MYILILIAFENEVFYKNKSQVLYIFYELKLSSIRILISKSSIKRNLG